MNWQGFKHQLLHYVSLENWAAVNVIQPGQSVKASDWAGPLDTGPAQGMAYQGRGSYTSSGRFFVPHLPLFEIRTTNLIHPYLPSTLTKHPHALLLPLCAAAAVTRGPRRRPGAACPTPRHRRRSCPPALPPPARVLPALVRRRRRHPRAAAGGQALLALPRAAATACAQTLRHHPRALLLSVPLPALPCCCAAAARRWPPAPEKTRRKC